MTKAKLTFLTKERLNLLIAICAILISLASFYATYLQANSAQKQVQAMTLPLLQFVHDNYDQTQNQRVIDFKLRNAGVGPAIIHTMSFNYQGQLFSNFGEYFRYCCGSEYQEYQSSLAEFSAQEFDVFRGGIVTDTLNSVTLAGQSEYLFLRIYYGDVSGPFWEKLDQERWNTALTTCYCTLLGDCFENSGNAQLREVNSCPVR